MAKVLVFFTASYPFGQGETFIENEITYLAEAFDKIVIVSNNTADMQTRETPSNVVLKRKSYELTKTEKLASLFTTSHPLFWKELKIIKSVYKKKVSPVIFNTMVQSLYKIKIWKPFISRIIQKYTNSHDSIILYSYWTNDMALVCSKFSHPQIKSSVCRAHGWDVYFEANESAYLPFRKAILQSISRQAFISETGKEYYNNLFPFLSSKMTVSRLGVPQNRHTDLQESGTTFRIVSCSNIIPLKRVRLIAESLAAIDDTQIEWHHFGDGILFEELKQFAKSALSTKHGITPKLHGRVSNQEYLAFLQSSPASLFINVSTTEGVPVSIMEAMSYGIPCFATQVGGNAEIVNESNGLLLPKDITPEALAEKIKWFYKLSNAEKRKMRESAYQTWDTMYNAEKNYKNFVNQILGSV